MNLVLIATAGVGVVTSFALLHAGLTRMAVRYPLAVLIAYAAFLLLLRVWLGLQRRRREHGWSDLDPSGIDLLPRGGSSPGPENVSFGGGTGGGGGAGGSWASAPAAPARPAVALPRTGDLSRR